MKYLAPIIILLLLIAHQDYWQWSRDDLLFDFLPYGLAYHMLLSLITAACWLVIVQTCWPGNDAEADPESEQQGASQ